MRVYHQLDGDIDDELMKNYADFEIDRLILLTSSFIIHRSMSILTLRLTPRMGMHGNMSTPQRQIIEHDDERGQRGIQHLHAVFIVENEIFCK